MRSALRRAGGRVRASARDAVRRRLSHDRVWRRELPGELRFWHEWVATGGLHWPQAYRDRLDPGAPLTEPLLADRIGELGADPVRILDVGAGPLTCLGKRHPDARLTITATDPLGEEYAGLLARAGIDPPVPTLAVRGEDLLDRFGADAFDVAYARNALDHSADPLAVVRNMVAVTRPGGLVALRHYRAEGARERYEELHQWNFEARGGRLLVWSRRASHDLTAELAGDAEVSAWEEPGSGHAPFVVAVMRVR